MHLGRVDGVHAPDKEVKVHADKSGKVVLINGDHCEESKANE
ncbi:hypothetical protein ACVPOW_11610 [Staphylococcus aureus]